MEKNVRRALLSWLFMGALFVLCSVLGFLQYRWIGEVSVAEQEHLAHGLQASLFRLSQDFNSELAAAARALLPMNLEAGEPGLETEIAARYRRWNTTSRRALVFDRIALAVPGENPLRVLDPASGVYESAAWPPAWNAVRERIAAGQVADGGRRPGRRGPRDAAIFELPLFDRGAGFSPRGTSVRPAPAAIAILQLNLQYVRDVMLPELVQRHLQAGGTLDYHVEVVSRGNPQAPIYQSDPGEDGRIAGSPDASIGLCDLDSLQVFGRGMPPLARDRLEPPDDRPSPVVMLEAPPGAAPAPGSGRRPDFGRWEMYVRHRAGSLDAAVGRARLRNVAVTGGVFLLMLATLAALIRYTRRAQKLAEMQMEFVAGVSHELRTPLTVIHTAGYNLQGRIAANPAQVERYGALIQKESGRLRDLVEQVLEFARVNTGRVIQEREPLSIEAAIEEALESSRPAIESAGCVVEKKIEPALPPVLGDRVALRHALENLIGNAAKYGSKPNRWIGIFASRSGGQDAPAVEIRVADRGPGIPTDEQKRIFDPFFRGRRAIEAQVHGTGLGLNLAKKIVEAHGGTLRVRSAPPKGTEFILRIPAGADGASV